LTWAKKGFTFTKNCRWFSTDTTKYFLPLTGNLSNSATGSDSDVNLLPPSSGRIKSILLESTGTPGTTILTLEDSISGTLGTVSFSYNGSGAVTILNFPDDFDTGAGAFNGLGRIRVGLDVAASAASGKATITFEFDL